MKLIDLTGKRFGNWFVVERAKARSGYDEAMWLCECQCGSGVRKVIGSQSLKRGDSRGCGCNNAKRLRSYEALYNRLVRDNSGRLRNVVIDLSYEDFLEFTKENNCFYCGADVQWQEFNSSGHGYNLDRKDNNQGYVKDNLVVCCQRCNAGKMDTFTFEEWYAMTAVLRNRNMEQEFSMKELIELHRQTLEVLKQAIALLEKLANPPMQFRLNEPSPYTQPYPTPWIPVQPGIGTAPSTPTWPNGTIICKNESNVMSGCRE